MNHRAHREHRVFCFLLWPNSQCPLCALWFIALGFAKVARLNCSTRYAFDWTDSRRRRRNRRSRRRRVPARTCCLRGVQGGARLVGECAKSHRVAHRDVGQNLPVHLDARELQSVHEDGVAHVVLPGTRVDADDPQPAEIPLFVLAIAVGVLPSALDVLLGRLPELGTSAEHALGVLEDLLLPLETRDVGNGTWHGRLLCQLARSRRLMRFCSPLVAMSPAWRSPRFRFEVFFVRIWLLNAL